MERGPACLLTEIKLMQVPYIHSSIHTYIHSQSTPPSPVIHPDLVRGSLACTPPPPQAEQRPSSQKGLDLDLGSVTCHSCLNLKEDA